MPLAFLNREATSDNYNRFMAEFKCQRCGKCCSGGLLDSERVDAIGLTTEDVLRLSEFLHISKKQFKEKYTFTRETKRMMPTPCPFISEQGCVVYSARPLVCRYFPLNQVIHKKGREWMTVGDTCPAGKVIADKYAVKVAV